MDENKELVPLATEIYEDLKRANKFKERLIYILLCVIAVLVIALVATNIYHIYQWSQYDTVIIDTGDSGNAVYSEGNSGGIYNGTNRSEKAQGWEFQGDES